MVGGWQGVILRALGAKEHVVRVTGRQLICPGFLRIHFASSTLFDQAEALPGAWIRLWFPDQQRRGREHQRGYTLIDADPSGGTFSIDFLLHQPAGPASAWADAAEPGDELIAQYMGSHAFVPVEGAAGLLVVADPCSIPAANSVLAAATSPTELLIEYSHESDLQIPVATDAEWFARGEELGVASRIAERSWEGWQIWLLGERATVREARKAVGGDRTKQDTHNQAYWVAGRAMGKTVESAA